MQLLQNVTPFRKIRHYRIRCKYKISYMHVYLECSFFKIIEERGLPCWSGVMNGERLSLEISKSASTNVGTGGSTTTTSSLPLPSSSFPALGAFQFLCGHGGECHGGFISIHRICEPNCWV
jgi:hypothetical protein